MSEKKHKDMTDEELRRDLKERADSARALFKRTMSKLGFTESMGEDMFRLAFEIGEFTGMLNAIDKVHDLREQHAILEAAKRLPIMAIAICLLIGCADARSGNNPSAERVFTSETGYVCFLIRDDEGKGVGGNCVKE